MVLDQRLETKCRKISHPKTWAIYVAVVVVCSVIMDSAVRLDKLEFVDE